MADETYEAKIQQQIDQYAKVENIHDLPDIFHYWSNKFLAPKMNEVFGTANPVEVFVNALREVDSGDPLRFLSVGAGDCSIEVTIAEWLHAHGLTDFTIECLELSPELLKRGQETALERGMGRHLSAAVVDVNSWRAEHKYDAVIAHHSLHHIVNLELLFDEILAALESGGVFVISDIIGRNGHMRWPEAMGIVEAIWANAPDGYKYNHQLKRYEETPDNWDCSDEGFEGVRAQDILPLLVERFAFKRFLAFGNLTDMFVDRSFGHNLSPEKPEDCAFIDTVHTINDLLVDVGYLKPTMVVAEMVRPGEPDVTDTRCYKHWTPEFCVRHGGRFDAIDSETRAELD